MSSLCNCHSDFDVLLVVIQTGGKDIYKYCALFFATGTDPELCCHPYPHNLEGKLRVCLSLSKTEILRNRFFYV